MSEWKRVRVADLAITKGLVGGPFGSSLGSKDYVESGIPVIRGINLGSKGKFSGQQFVFVTPKKANGELSRNLAIPGDLVFTQRGTLGQVGIVPPSPFDKYVISQSQMRLRVDPDISVTEFVYYQFRSPEMIRTIHSRAIATGVPHINLGILGDLEITLPPQGEQRAIATVLGVLDDKIAINERVTALAHDLMETHFQREVGAESGMQTLGEIAKFHNRKRVPLSSRQRAEMPGPYPYYGAAGIVDYVRDYLFRGSHVLVGEDGTVITGNSRPVVQYLWGDFWVNNHAHVLTGVSISTELLAIALRFTDVASLVTGAVQPKLNMGNLSRLPVSLPIQEKRADLESVISHLWAVIRQRQDETRTLAALRDTLLPQLMSGRLRVRDAEQIVEDAL